ncbi:nitrite/sulfite reductase [Gordonia sp. HY285]|uniref:assimilatory sulfite reductase (ferredoxin) n=1 Tax=Gordonia liuliyuniae TaxID=2911517 RepID=A0ABS9IVA8_9ACTN|nr:nitrite/sulfite reductase [Gordonia liuliyuniae]MCF8589466.1 nitrite/sulfite reductase [Gordonia liuliyuniae]MCF8611423.1 nitrite/sulfite reductase [Gordonia liuliyuniae]
MTLTSTESADQAAQASAAAPRKRARPTKRKSEGQWALGYRTPLNPNEQSKRDDNPLNVRRRILDTYQHVGFDGIDKADLRGRFRWMGLYTQRADGYDGTYTHDDNIDILEAPYFMMRVRTDGGQLSIPQVRALAGISRDFARGTADVTDRQNIQYHWIEIENVPEIWRRLDEVGLDTTEACGDCPRGMLGSPLAGLSVDEVLDASPALAEIKRRYIGNPEYSNLPRKFKTAISGLQDVVHEINDVSFVGVEHPEHGPGLDLWVGGGLSTNPMLAKRLGVWVPLDEVPDVWEGVVAIFRDYGYRRLRSKARLKFLMKDWGPEKFRQVLEDEYLHRKLVDGPAPEAPTQPIDHVGVTKQKNGQYAVGFSAVSGRLSDVVLDAIADSAETAGSDSVRLTPYQKLVVVNVDEDKIAGLDESLTAVGLQSRPSVWRRNLIACTGLEYCKLSFTETRSRSQALVPEMESRLAELNKDLDVPITINFNGCPNSCARVQVADIGLKGQLIDEGGTPVEGFQVHLGGSLGFDSGFGRKLRQHKIYASEATDYIERVVRNFVTDRNDGERFAEWAVRADDEKLR